MRTWSTRASAALGGLILACAGARVEPTPSPNAALAVRTSAPAPCAARPAAPAERRAELSVRLRPLHDDDGGRVEVALQVTAPASELRSWRVPRLAGPLDVRVTVAADCGGAAARQSVQGSAGQLLALELPPGGSTDAAPLTVQLEYGVPAQRLAAPYWRLEPDWFLAQGRRLLLLPEDRGWSADVRVEIDAGGYGPEARGVSSLGLSPAPPGVPQAPVQMTVAALEHSLFAAGKLGSAQFLAREGQDEAAWFGSTGFDVRLLAAEVASFRTAVREVLLDGSARPLTLIVMSDLQQGFEARRAPVSVLLRMAPWERANAGLRLDVLQQVMKEWIGGRLSVQDEGGVEPLWFAEGLSRYLARELALEFGMISPEEFAADINALMAIQAVLERHECTRVAPAEPDPDTDVLGAAPCARVLQAARGILHATQLDTALHARRSSLVQLVAALIERGGGPLTPSEWRAALEAAGGSAALHVHESFLAAGARPLLLPSNAFGSCFVREPTRYVQSVRGFQLEPAVGAAQRVLAVEPRSPAEAAGLRAGALVQRIEHVPYDRERPLRVVLEDGKRVEYRGGEARVPGYAWRRVRSVRDEQCRMSGRDDPVRP